MSSPQKPFGLAVRLPFATPEELLQRYGANLSRGGVYLRTKVLKAPGTPVTLEIKLQNGQRAIYGNAVVRYVTGNRGEGVLGMGFTFVTLDAASRRFLDAAAATMPHARSSEPPLPKNVGPADSSPDALSTMPMPEVAPSQVQAQLPSEQTGRLLVQASNVEVQAPPFVVTPLGPRTGPIIGIDLGTTNTCVAVMRADRPVVLKSREGATQLPSVVALSPRGRFLIGAPARAQVLTNPRLTVTGHKRLLGRTFDSLEVAEMRLRFPWAVVATDSGDCGAKLGDRVFRLEELSAMLLNEAREIAQAELGLTVNRAVITVPAWYSDKQRQAVRDAGLLAGLHVERIVNEPTAAALAYGYGLNLKKRVLVYDLGGGTFDASILELNDTVYEVVSTGGEPFLGGMDFDNAVVESLLADFEAETGTVLSDKVAVSRVLDAAERAKILLSTKPEARINVPFIGIVDGKPRDLDVTLPRRRLVELTSHLIERTMALCQQVLESRYLRADQIDEVLLVGGQSRAPQVHERLTVLFGRKPAAGVNPDEAVALGAALLGHSLDQRSGLLLIDVLPMSIGVGLPGGLFRSVLSRNTALPATRTHRIFTTRDSQQDLELPIFQGESTRVRDNTFLGTFKMTGLEPGPRGTVAVSLTFEVSNECVLKLTAVEEATGRELVASFATRDTPAQVKARVKALEEEPPPPPPRGFTGWLKKLF